MASGGVCSLGADGSWGGRARGCPPAPGASGLDLVPGPTPRGLCSWGVVSQGCAQGSPPIRDPYAAGCPGGSHRTGCPLDSGWWGGARAHVVNAPSCCCWRHHDAPVGLVTNCRRSCARSDVQMRPRVRRELHASAPARGLLCAKRFARVSFGARAWAGAGGHCAPCRAGAGSSPSLGPQCWPPAPPPRSLHAAPTPSSSPRGW